MAAGTDRYQIFLRVVELDNITRAAESLSYTQSGVSHAIRASRRSSTSSVRSSRPYTR